MKYFFKKEYFYLCFLHNFDYIGTKANYAKNMIKEDEKMTKIKLVEVKSDLGGRRAGASLGIDSLRIASYKKQDYFNFFHQFEENPNLYARIEADNYLFNSPNIKHKYCKHIENLLPIYEKTAAEVAAGIKNCDFIFVLAGDHSTACGTLAGIKQVYPEKRIGVVWIDAHADIHSPYTSDSGNMHGMPLAAASNNDNLKHKINDLDKNTIQLWECVKNIGGVREKFQLDDLVYVALRDYEAAESHLISKHNARIVNTLELRNNGAINTARNILQHLSACDIIYLSFDVDSMDTSVSTGTGTPVTDGLSSCEAKELLCELATSTKVKCLEISEINPTLDNCNKMSEVVFEILASVVK